MKFSLVTRDILSLNSDMLALGVFEEVWSEEDHVKKLDAALNGALCQLALKEAFSGKDDQVFIIHPLEKIGLSKIMLFGLGKRNHFMFSDTRPFAARVSAVAEKTRCHTLAICPPIADSSSHEKAIQLLVEGIYLGQYRFDRYKSKSAQQKSSLESVAICFESNKPDSLRLALSRGEIIAKATCLARDLVNEPAATLTPSYLAEQARKISEQAGLECKIFGPKECEKNKMRLLLAVSQGSVEEPRFIHLKYRPRGKIKPKHRIVLVGKGITFDSGGLSLKPSASMVDMKTDMAGAAVLLGIMQSLPALGLTLEVHCLVPAAENMLSGTSLHIGDVITGLSGKSIEIVNTDAEGRLILADALAYAQKLAPDEVIDIATLTGACMVALGPHMAGVMGNDTALVERYLAAARLAGEEAWHLPLPERLKEQLKSSIADLKNAGERWGGALTAGLFLKEFVGSYPWIHVDIAGPSCIDKDWGHQRKGGTGYGVATLLQYLITREDF